MSDVIIDLHFKEVSFTQCIIFPFVHVTFFRRDGKKKCKFILWVLSESLGTTDNAESGSWWKKCSHRGRKVTAFSEWKTWLFSRRCCASAPVAGGCFSAGCLRAWATWHRSSACKTTAWVGGMQKVITGNHVLFSHLVSRAKPHHKYWGPVIRFILANRSQWGQDTSCHLPLQSSGSKLPSHKWRCPAWPSDVPSNLNYSMDL